MLEGYGFGQHIYSMHQESWQNGYHQGHLSGMPNCFMESPPRLSTHQMMMLHGNHVEHQEARHAQNVHQNAWQTENMRQQHWIVSPEKHGRFNSGYVINVGPVASTGGKYPNLIASSEYESFGRIQRVPVTVRFKTRRSEYSHLQGNGCQDIEWVSKVL